MEELQTHTGQIKAAEDLESSLTCSIVRFLKGPLRDCGLNSQIDFDVWCSDP